MLMLSLSQRNTEEHSILYFLKFHFRNVAQAWFQDSLEKVEVANTLPHCSKCGLRKRHQYHELGA